jgi:hypothetical protein
MSKGGWEAGEFSSKFGSSQTALMSSRFDDDVVSFGVYTFALDVENFRAQAGLCKCGTNQKCSNH